MIDRESDTPGSGMAAFVPFARFERWTLAAGFVIAVAARFVTGSPLWLDEALSVHIAELPVGDLLDALRRDGHPPLYYLILHGWIDVFGDGDVAVRALSGLVSVVTLPVAYVAGRRRGGPTLGVAVVGLTAITPFAVRYATEARMYSLVTLLVFVGWLLADDLRRSPNRWKWTALAVTTGLALLTHYWVLYLGAATVLALVLGWWRAGRRDEALRIGSAMAAGCLLFVPWLGAFADQLAHTGTPWGTATRPTRAVVELAAGLGGGETFAEGLVYGFGFLVLVGVGATAAAWTASSMTIDLRGGRDVHPEMLVATLTVAIGLAVGAVTDATFVSRYAAVVLPLLVVVAGRGLAALPAPLVRAVVAAGLVVLAAVGIGFNIVDDRTQGAQHVTTIEAQGEPGDLVAFCPDQLGPSTVRELDGPFETVGLPAMDSGSIVDWTDYEDRNRSADPAAVAGALIDRAGGRRIWLVTQPGYRTYEGLCEGIQVSLTAARPDARVVTPAREVFEPSQLVEFPSGT